MFSKIISDIIVLLISILKYPFVMMGIVATGGDPQSILFNVVGGLTGIFLFTFGGAFFENLYLKFFPVKRFSTKSRFLAFIKDKFGVWGIALSSVIITVPGSILLCLSITKNKWEIIRKMILSLSFWSLIFYLINFIIHHL